MKNIAIILGFSATALLAAGVAFLLAIVLLWRSEASRGADISSNITPGPIFIPSPIPFTPQPASSLPTPTPSITLIAAPSATLIFIAPPTATPVPITPSSTGLSTPVIVNQADTALSTTITAGQADVSNAASPVNTFKPERLPDAMGRLSRRDGNNIFIESGFWNRSIVEVVVTANTIIYRDTTDLPQPGSANPSGGMPLPGNPFDLQLAVEQTYSLDEISDQALILVWGEKQGDQVTAQILVYHLFNGH